MTSRCSNSSCLNGNCQGCRNGVKFCNDPRCYPNCPDCDGESSIDCVTRRDGWDWGLLIAITALALLAIFFLAWGFFSYSKMEKERNQPAPVKIVDAQTPVVRSAQRAGFAPPNTNAPPTGFPPRNVDTLPRVPRANLPVPGNASVASARQSLVRPSVPDSTIRGF